MASPPPAHTSTVAQASTVAIVGSGLIGRAWAAIFARAGWTVRLSDPHAPTLEAAPRLVLSLIHI